LTDKEKAALPTSTKTSKSKQAESQQSPLPVRSAGSYIFEPSDLLELAGNVDDVCVHPIRLEAQGLDQAATPCSRVRWEQPFARYLSHALGRLWPCSQLLYVNVGDVEEPIPSQGPGHKIEI
jgi:hypothetical protein